MTASIRDTFSSVLLGPNERVVSIDHPSGRFLVQNYHGRPALVARVNLSHGNFVGDGRGFFISTQHKDGEDFVRIVSSEVGLNPIFLKLVDYVLERTVAAVDYGGLERALPIAIEEFRSFTQRRRGRMSEAEIRGLTAEMMMVCHLHNLQPSRTWDIFHSWGGPFGALRDFVFADGRSLEIKSTHQGSDEIRVGSDQQLRPIAEGLELAVLPLELVSSRAPECTSFVELVDSLTEISAIAGNEVSRLWGEIKDILGLDITDEYYQQWIFRPGEWRLFVVRNGFPMIPDDLLSPSLTKVAYSLRIDTLTEFEIGFAELEARA